MAKPMKSTWIDEDEIATFAKGSKAVDEDGKALALKHGTLASFDDFEVTGNEGEAGGALFGNGIYFTDNEDYAKFFSTGGDNENKDGTMFDVVLNVKNPYEVQVNSDYDFTNNLKQEGYSDAEQWRKELESQGYDGIKATRYEDRVGGDVVEWIAFHPHQVGVLSKESFQT